MKLPKFLFADHPDYEDDIFIIHTQYPKFVINLKDDETQLLEDFEEKDIDEELKLEIANLIKASEDFYDTQIKKYEE